MEISHFDTKYSLHNVSDFVKCLSESKRDENMEPYLNHSQKVVLKRLKDLKRLKFKKVITN